MRGVRAGEKRVSAPAKARAAEHIHLPSVHLRGEDGSGFDYDEDLFVSGRGRRQWVERVVRLVVIERDGYEHVRETRDTLCAEEMEQLRADLPILMDEENPASAASMKECANKEMARQIRIARGEEQVCHACGCSETRSCSGGCLWATATLCSRCV